MFVGYIVGRSGSSTSFYIRPSVFWANGLAAFFLNESSSFYNVHEVRKRTE